MSGHAIERQSRVTKSLPQEALAWVLTSEPWLHHFLSGCPGVIHLTSLSLVSLGVKCR